MPSFEDDDIRWLLKMLDYEGLAELEVAQGELRVALRAPQPPPAPAAPSEGEPETPEGTPVLAPMAGIYYRTPSPDSEPFVEEGDVIKRGDVVGLIEAMKLFNEVTSPVAGVITAIALENEQRVAAGQPLMWVAPEAGDQPAEE
jgi:acetyl-CoA carboxylase biotin carboxyl carrier protein